MLVKAIGLMYYHVLFFLFLEKWYQLRLAKFKSLYMFKSSTICKLSHIECAILLADRNGYFFLNVLFSGFELWNMY